MSDTSAIPVLECRKLSRLPLNAREVFVPWVFAQNPCFTTSELRLFYLFSHLFSFVVMTVRCRKVRRGSRLEPIALQSDSYQYAIGRSVLKEINLISDDCVRRYFLTFTLWGYVIFFSIHQWQLPWGNDVLTLRRKIWRTKKKQKDSPTSDLVIFLIHRTVSPMGGWKSVALVRDWWHKWARQSPELYLIAYFAPQKIIMLCGGRFASGLRIQKGEVITWSRVAPSSGLPPRKKADCDVTQLFTSGERSRDIFS